MIKVRNISSIVAAVFMLLFVAIAVGRFDALSESQAEDMPSVEVPAEDIPCSYDSDALEADFFITGAGTPNITAMSRVASSSVSCVAGAVKSAAIPLVESWRTLCLSCSYPVCFRHTLYYVFALHHMRN